MKYTMTNADWKENFKELSKIFEITCKKNQQLIKKNKELQKQNEILKKYSILGDLFNYEKANLFNKR